MTQNVFTSYRSSVKPEEEEESDESEEELMPGEMSHKEVEKLFEKGLTEERLWRM
jgi:hypothetical protein